MTPTQIDIVRRSHILLLLQQRAVLRVLREQVLQADPELRPLVVTGDSNLDHQPVQWLSAVVSLLDKPSLLQPSLQALALRLGRRWGPQHLARLGRAYLATLQTCLGPRWNPETAAAWTALHDVIQAALQAPLAAARRQATHDTLAA